MAILAFSRRSISTSRRHAAMAPQSMAGKNKWDRAAVQATKTLWDRAAEHSGRRSHTLKFERLLGYFGRGDLRFSEIASICGVTPERVRQIYERYFRRLLGDRSGLDRYRTYARCQNAAERQAVENAFLTNNELQPIIQRARGASCVVHAVPGDGRNSSILKLKSLYINDRLCSVLRATKVTRSSDGRRAYFQFHLARSVVYKVDMVIFHCATTEFPHRIFVVPRQVLAPLFNGNSSRSRAVYLPTQKLRTHRNQRPRVDYWRYENDWNQLGPYERARRR